MSYTRRSACAECDKIVPDAGNEGNALSRSRGSERSGACDDVVPPVGIAFLRKSHGGSNAPPARL